MALRDEIARRVEAGEGEPPEIVLFKMANDRRVKVPIRQQAAAALMPYIHPRLNSTDLNVTPPKAPLRIIVQKPTP